MERVWLSDPRLFLVRSPPGQHRLKWLWEGWVGLPSTIHHDVLESLAAGHSAGYIPRCDAARVRMLSMVPV